MINNTDNANLPRSFDEDWTKPDYDTDDEEEEPESC